MRWADPNAKDWVPLFDEGVGDAKVTIEKGEGDFYRVKYFRGKTEAILHLHGATKEELAGKLINEGMFTDDEARMIAEKIVNHPLTGKQQ